jgi:hypothetical protein
MNMNKFKLFLATLFLSPFLANAQQTSLTEYSQKANKITQKGMYTLGGWAVGNLIYSGLSVGSTTGETKAFHQMNLGWGAINATLAGLGVLNTRKTNSPNNQLETLEMQYSVEKTFLFNTALDVAYVAGGYAMTQYGENQIDLNKRDRNIGFGKSVMLQGGFLFLFDAVMYGVHRKHYKENRVQFMNTGNAVGLRYSLN